MYTDNLSTDHRLFLQSCSSQKDRDDEKMEKREEY